MPREARVCDMHRVGTWTGSKSFVFAVRTGKCLVRSKSELNITISSAAYKSYPGLTGLIAVSTSQSECPSLNQRGLPRLTAPGETLRERIDLIVVPARK